MTKTKPNVRLTKHIARRGTKTKLAQRKLNELQKLIDEIYVHHARIGDLMPDDSSADDMDDHDEGTSHLNDTESLLTDAATMLDEFRIGIIL